MQQRFGTRHMAGRLALGTADLFQLGAFLFGDRAQWVLLATTHKWPPELDFIQS
jgi:hypothetical protein